MASPTDRVVAQAIEDWYTRNYPLGIRLTFQQRAALAASITFRLGLVESKSQDVPR